MTYSSGGPGYPGAQHSGAYAPPPQHSQPQRAQQPSPAEEGPSKLPVYLLAAVAVLGLAAYLLTFGPVWDAGEFAAGGITMLGIIAILVAAIFAAIALAPKQANHTALVTAAAAVGFLLVIWDLISNADLSGWALIAIVVVSALQTIAAVGALLMDAGVISPPAPRPKYEPYQPQYGGYYGQPQGPPQGQHQAPPQLSGPGPQHSAPPPPPSSQPTHSFSLPQGGPKYGGYQSGSPSSAAPLQAQQDGPPTPPTGFPTFAPPSSASTTEAKAPSHYDAPTQEVRAPEGLRAPDQPSPPSGPPPS